MKVENKIKIASKCSLCGSLNIKDISIFNFSGKSKLHKYCSCGNLLFTISTVNHSKYYIEMNCMACGNSHHYSMSYKKLWNGNTHIIKCPDKDMEIAFIGKDGEILEQIDFYQEKLNRIVDDSFEEYFCNSYVMFEAFNKVQDIADKGNIYCSCGSSDFKINLFMDRIEFSCNSCWRSSFINAGNNEQLNLLKTKDYIIIGMIGKENMPIIKQTEKL